MRFRIISFILSLVISLPIYAQKDIQTIKKRIVADIFHNFDQDYFFPMLAKSGSDDSSVKQLCKEIRTDGSWPGINYKDVSLTGFEHPIHLRNCLILALSYCQKKSMWYKSEIVKNTLNSALRYWADKNFVSDNWWHNIILTPTIMVSVCLIMKNDIDPDILQKLQPIIERANKDNPWARQSADRVRICGIQAENYILNSDSAGFNMIINIIEDQLKFTTGERGLQCDYSFHHRVHRVNNTTSYGLSYANVCDNWASYVAGTKYAFSPSKVKLLVNYYLDGICKQMAYGIYHDANVQNRDITRKLVENIYSPEPLEKLLSYTDYRKDEIKEIIALRKKQIEKPKLSFCKFFWQSEHFVFQRPDFYTSVRMFSIRNRNMEMAHNSEGIFNHHKADGANFLTVKGDEYLNIWPAYDWQKIPGATILQKPKLPPPGDILKDGLTSFVGAATDGLYGVVGFDFISPHSFIRAKKSWFFFDHEYVCLGAGIASNDFNNPVVTTLNQSLLRGDVLVSKGGDVSKLERGVHVIDNVNWVFHDGTGYLFPKPENIHLSNETDTGRWSDINLQITSPKELVKKDIFKLWIDHGTRPQGENLWLYPGKMDTKDVTYQYIVVPVTTPDKLNRYNDIEILSDNSNIQAVKNKLLNIAQFVFYRAGSVEINKGLRVTMDSPGIIMLKMKGDKVVEITGSDPTRTLTKLHVGLSGDKNIVLDLPQGDYAGSSTTVKL